ncbi:MAG: hypothetical protein K8I60_06715 [Anaerolineae bacterium]|nr:hypothetical protein [Anaerolineae bacterium]
MVFHQNLHEREYQMTNRRNAKATSVQRLMKILPAQTLDSELARLRETVEHLRRFLRWLNPLLSIESAEIAAQSPFVVDKRGDEIHHRGSQYQLENWDNEGGKTEYVAR